jgi:hypothetical protein
VWYDPNNPIKGQLALAREKVRLVAQGQIVCTAIFGPAGVGKTHLCRSVFEELDMKQNEDWVLTRGSGIGLLHNAYEMRRGGTLLMDDCDELVIGGGQSHTNRMKELLAPERVRTISNFTDKALSGKGEGLPPSFTTTCGAIWLTNINLTDLTDRDRKRIDPLLSRGMIPATVSQDPLHLLNYVISLVMDGGMKLKAGETKGKMHINLSLEETNDVLRYFAMNAWHLQTICLRQLFRLATYRRLSPDSWHKLADAELRPVAISKRPLPPVPYIAVA